MTKPAPIATSFPSRARKQAVVLAFILLAGCTVGPKYQVPTVQTPAAFKEPVPTEFSESPDWKPGRPSDGAIRPKWWEIFGDKQLNNLEEQVDLSNQSLKVAEARFRQARSLIRFNQASLLPTISTQPSIYNQHISAAQSSIVGGGQTGGNFILPFDLSYEVDLWGKIHKQVEAAREEFQATAADLQSVGLSLHSELAYDYFELRSLDSQKKVLDDTVVAYEKALELTDNRYEGGLSPKSEVAQAAAQLETTRAQDIDIGVMRAQFEHAIGVLIGQPPETFSLTRAPLQLRPPVIPIGVPSELLQRRPDIAAAERRVAEANAQIGIARTAFYPSLVISASGGFQGGSLINWLIWPSRFWAVGSSLGQTLFDNGRRKATSEAAAAGYDATVAEYRQTALNAFQEVEDNLAALRILSDEARIQRSAVEASEESLALSTNRYKGGLVTYLEVITAQSIALGNERTEVDIERRRMDASVLLIKALGGGWDAGSLPAS
jgi:NodT family efflux transporter outer membrane factor (OMF) lipoprotein